MPSDSIVVDGPAAMKRILRFLDWVEEHEGELDGILFDVDGTLVRGEAAIPGARRLLDRLVSKSIPYLLVTNDANHSHGEKAAALKRRGIEVSDDCIVSAGDVVAKIVRERGLSGQQFFVMGDLGRPGYAETAGVLVTRTMSELSLCRGVIVGEENYNWEPTFNAVINFFISNPDAPFIVPNPDIYWPDGERGIAIGAGGKARFISLVLEEYGVPLQPEYLGKPHRAVFDYARTRLEEIRGSRCEDPSRIVMIGDSLRGDVRGANRAGYQSALVLTGITVPRQLDGIGEDSDMRPDYLVEAL